MIGLNKSVQWYKKSLLNRLLKKVVKKKVKCEICKFFNDHCQPKIPIVQEMHNCIDGLKFYGSLDLFPLYG